MGDGAEREMLGWRAMRGSWRVGKTEREQAGSLLHLIDGWHGRVFYGLKIRMSCFAIGS